MGATATDPGGGTGLGRTIAFRAAMIVLAVGMLSEMAPWGTWRQPFWHRSESFLVCALIWEACVLAARRIVCRVVPARFAGTALPMVLVLLVASLPATLGTMVAILLLSGGLVPFVPLYAESLLLGLAISFARRGLTSGWGRVPASPTMLPTPETVPQPEPPCARLLERHAPALRGSRVLALEAEDHYLRIHVVGGSALVLLRLRDAIDLLGQEAGWQPHRSFWIASDVRARAERRGQAWRLVLENGLAVPVSRGALPAMRAAGFGPGSAQTPASAIAVGSTAE